MGVLIATAAGVLLRIWNLGQLGLDHFDEGVYALGGLWITSPRGLAALDPGLIPYAPGVFPTAVGLAYLVFGISDLSAIAVSIAAGVATIPVAAWLARRGFGSGAGVAAAWLAAFSGPHVTFSRTALTDTCALLAFLIALGLGLRFLERPGFLRAAWLGLAVGLAQNTKYNGFLAGVIVAVAWAAGWLSRTPQEPQVTRADPPRPWRVLALLMLATLVAALCYVPWYRFVSEQPGGYGALIAHHRGYFHGATRWLANLHQQLAQAHFLSGELAGRFSWAAIAAGLATLATAFASPSPGERRGTLTLVLALGSAISFGLMPTLSWWLAGLVAIAALTHPDPPRRGLACGWLVMTVLTPLYHPYARLWLPLEALGWLLVAGGLRAAVASVRDRSLSVWLSRRRSPPRLALTAGVLLAISGAAATTFGPWGKPILAPELLGPRNALRDWISGYSALHVRNARVRVLARPALLFYLGTAGVSDVVRCRSILDLAESHTDHALRLLDELVLRQQSSDPNQIAPVWRSEPAGDRVDISLPTLLDVDPGAVFGTLLVRVVREGSGVKYERIGWGPDNSSKRRPCSRIWLLPPRGTVLDPPFDS